VKAIRLRRAHHFEGQNGDGRSLEPLAALRRFGARLHRHTQPFEVFGEHVRRLVAIVRALGEQPVDDVLELNRVVRRELPHGHMRLFADRRDERAPRQDVKGPGARGHLVQNDAE
jgi:hypothetical protein